jgi:hypothetical protein
MSKHARATNFVNQLILCSASACFSYPSARPDRRDVQRGCSVSRVDAEATFFSRSLVRPAYERYAHSRDEKFPPLRVRDTDE